MLFWITLTLIKNRKKRKKLIFDCHVHADAARKSVEAFFMRLYKSSASQIVSKILDIRKLDCMKSHLFNDQFLSKTALSSYSREMKVVPREGQRKAPWKSSNPSCQYSESFLAMLWLFVRKWDNTLNIPIFSALAQFSCTRTEAFSVFEILLHQE